MSDDYMEVSTLGRKLVSIANSLDITTTQAKKHNVSSLLDIIGGGVDSLVWSMKNQRERIASGIEGSVTPEMLGETKQAIMKLAIAIRKGK